MAQAIQQYGGLTQGGTRQVELTQEEECAVLMAYDYGVYGLSPTDHYLLGSVIAKLKEKIWP